MGAALASAGLGFLLAGFSGFAISFLLGVVAADAAGVNCVSGGCGALARSAALLGGTAAGVGGALTGFRQGLRRGPGAESAKRSTS